MPSDQVPRKPTCTHPQGFRTAMQSKHIYPAEVQAMVKKRHIHHCIICGGYYCSDPRRKRRGC